MATILCRNVWRGFVCDKPTGHLDCHMTFNGFGKGLRIEWPNAATPPRPEVQYHCTAHDADGKYFGNFTVHARSMSEALLKASKSGEVQIRPGTPELRVRLLESKG